MDLVKSGRLHLLAASCECRFHSNARGGGPCNEQSRSQPWQLVRWATDIDVDNIMMENVREFLNWGPLNRRTKRPVASRKGEYFRAFANALINLGYCLDYRVQVAADYGDPTSRPRLILIARKGKQVIWPEPSHGPGRVNAWRTARECIDRSLVGVSIFERARLGLPALRPNTVRRIIAGLRKFGGEAAEPFIAILNGSTPAHISASAKSLNAPLPSVVASGNHIMLCEPFIQHCTHAGNDEYRSHSLDKPMPSVTGAPRGELRLVEPFLQAYHNGEGSERRTHSLDEPLPTQDTSNRFGLVEPEIIIQTDQAGGNGYARNLDRPLPTIVTKQNMLLVQMILKYYKTGRCKPLDTPLDSITTKPRFMLVEASGNTLTLEFDLRTRMLQPSELALAHSFPSHYQFTGNKADQTKQIGNSVPVELAAAHAAAALS